MNFFFKSLLVHIIGNLNRIKLLSFTLTLLISSSVIAQTITEKNKILQKTDIVKLQSLQKKYQKKQTKYKKEADSVAKLKGWELTKTDKFGSFMELVRISSTGEPMYYATHNRGGAKTSKANTLWTGGSTGLNLNGENITLGIWDVRLVDIRHQEWQNNIFVSDTSKKIHPHSTHVAGTMVAKGFVPEAKGMASKARLNSYDWLDDTSEMTTAAANGLLLSNHSYGWGGVFQNQYGRYDEWAQSWDEIMFNAPYYLIVQSAGNLQDAGYNPTKNGYDLLSGATCSKNGLIVAATRGVENYIDSSSVIMSFFSSWGPTDDGRIKPDISTKGVNVYSTFINENRYFAASGTSMAAPNVTASLGLLQQHYKNVSNGYMKSATLRALVLATASEAGDAPGPDYRFGWGLLNVETAALAISGQGDNTMIEELNLNNQSNYSTTINSNGTSPLTVAIAWTDKEGEPVVGVDNSQPMLINDLDVRVSKDGTTFMPWKLDPGNPSNAATKGDNLVDNIETININNMTAGSYTITVSHKGTLIGGNQNFSLIVIGGSSNVPTCIATTPNNLKLNNIDDTSAIISWDLVSITSSYSYRYREIGASTWISNDFENNTAGLTNLVSSTDYEAQVRTNCTNNNSSYSPSLTFSTLVHCAGTVPTITSVVRKLNLGSLEMDHKVSWDAIDSVEKYNVKFREVNTIDWSNTVVDTPFATLVDLAFETQYEVQVNSVCNNGNISAFTESFYFTTAIACTNSPVENIRTTSVSDTEVTIEWDTIDDGRFYGLVLSSSNHFRIFDQSIKNSITYTGLIPGSSYDIMINSICNTGNPIAEFEFTTTGVRPCIINPISGYVASNYTVDGATITWDEIPTAIKYNYKYNIGGNIWVSGSTTTNSVTLTNLPLKHNQIRVSAECTVGSTPYTNFGFIIPQVGDSCGDYPPENIHTTNIDDNSVTINWDVINEVLSYQVKYKPAGSNTYLEVETYQPVITLTNLIANTNYDVLIGATCLFGGYLEGQFNFTTTGGTSCVVVPTGLSVSNITMNSADLSWNAVAGVNSYNYRYRMSGGNWVIQTSSNTSVALNGLSSGETYQVQVNSECSNGTSSYSDVLNFTTNQCTVAVPDNLSVSGITLNEATINWDGVLNATSYNYRYRTSGGGNWITGTSNTESTIINGLTPETTYEFQVNAACSNATSNYSGIISFTTDLCFVTDPDPTSIHIVKVKSYLVEIVWDEVPNATSYNIRYKAVNGSSWVTSAVEYTYDIFTGFINDTDYEMQIRAKCSSTVSSNYVSFFFKTPEEGETYCGLPAKEFRVTDLGPTNVDLKWHGIYNGSDFLPTIYQVKYKKAGGWFRYRVVGINEISLTNLEPNADYEVKVRAYCFGGGTSPFADLNFTTLATGAGAGNSGSIGYIVYPNPNNGSFTIDFGGKKENIQTVTVYNMLGVRVLHKNYNSKLLNKEQYSLKSVENGLYKIVIKTDKTVEYKTVLIKL